MVTLSDLGVTLNVAVLNLVNKVITTPNNNSPRSVMDTHLMVNLGDAT
jgi:hypothetical protein